MDSNEINRQMRNAVRKGSIFDIDFANALCRVSIGESDENGLQTNWMPWLTPAAGDTREWLPPSKGEQVMVLGPMGDLAQGVALRGFFSDAFGAPDQSPNAHTRTYKDGARVSYDFAAHALNAVLPAGATVRIVAPVSVIVETDVATVKAKAVTIDAKNTTVTGALLVKGPFTFQSGMTGSDGSGQGGAGAVMTIQGSARFTGVVTADTDVKSKNVSLTEHPHDARGEYGRTSGPIAGAS
ncbi:phage baseplate assembly protein V [Burkholderia sp. Bp9140]|uniref:phage baseplate assembly protein V n=1 Tax=Burkholderia sp. Bp9140 TaxID=2184572 RepID=UPI000F55E6CB|nr:phage baseplate assembly protein V [Burkholderia sp. Bp9140]RQR50461.1 phage baseplate assembly protein V [Burkholderia sp. Bp9140]